MVNPRQSRILRAVSGAQRYTCVTHSARQRPLPVTALLVRGWSRFETLHKCGHDAGARARARSASAMRASRARGGRCRSTTAARRSTSTPSPRRWPRSCRTPSAPRMRSRRARARGARGGLTHASAHATPRHRAMAPHAVGAACAPCSMGEVRWHLARGIFAPPGARSEHGPPPCRVRRP